MHFNRLRNHETLIFPITGFQATLQYLPALKLFMEQKLTAFALKPDEYNGYHVLTLFLLVPMLNHSESDPRLKCAHTLQHFIDNYPQPIL